MEDCEVWKMVEDYPNYMVSNFGRIKSLNYGGNTGKEKIRKPKINIDGYLCLTLYKDGKPKEFRINRLVALAFLPNPDNLPEVNHKDCDIKNNHVDNLEWCTRSYNINYGDRNKKVLLTRKKNNSYTVEKPVIQIDLNNVPIKTWPSINEAGRNGFDNGHIWACCHNKQKSHKGYKWMFFLPPALPLK